MYVCMSFSVGRRFYEHFNLLTHVIVISSEREEREKREKDSSENEPAWGHMILIRYLQSQYIHAKTMFCKYVRLEEDVEGFPDVDVIGQQYTHWYIYFLPSLVDSCHHASLFT